MKVLSQEDSDDLRQYLLGNLSEDRRELIEKQLLTDGNFHEELEVAEDELIDEYLSGNLSEQERRQFEKTFPSTNERQHKIQFAHSFNDFLTSNPREEREASFGVLPAPNSTLRIITGILFLTVILLLGGIWFVNRPQQEQLPEVQPIVIVVVPGATSLTNTQVTRLSRPKPNLTVHVQIEINISDYPKYQIELVRETESLLKSEPLNADKTNGRYVVNVPIDSSLLEVGDYGIKLSGIPESGEPEFKDQYHFQVIQ